MRGGRRLTEKLPNPRISMRCPRTRASLIASRMVLTAYSASRWVSLRKARCEFFDEVRAGHKARAEKQWTKKRQRGHQGLPLLFRTTAYLLSLLSSLARSRAPRARRARVFACRLLAQVGHGALLVDHVLLLDGQLDVAGLAIHVHDDGGDFVAFLRARCGHLRRGRARFPKHGR